MNQQDDPFLLWVISGIIGVIIRDIYSTFAKLVGLSKIFIWDVGADLFVTGKEVHGVFGEILGFSTDFVVGGMLGVTIGLLLEWRGQKFSLFKGWIVGLLAWFFLFGIVFHSIPETAPAAPKDAFSNISAFIGHSIFGIATAWVYLKLTVIKASRSKLRRA